MTRILPTHDLRGPTGLDEDARRVILRALEDRGVTPAHLVDQFLRRGAYSGIRDYLRAVEEVHTTEAGLQVIEAMRSASREFEDDLALDWEREGRRAAAAGMPVGLLLGMPTADFLTAVEFSISNAPDASAGPGGLVSEINRICEVRGIHYRLDGRPPEFEWTGDVVIQKNVLGPALSALDDPRLRSGPKVEFDSARREMRTNTRDSRKQAVAESCNAVESMMKILCAERGINVPLNATAQPLYDALVASGILPRENEAMVLGPARFGNRRGRHGAGAVAHDVTEAEAEQVVAAAATAIAYLAKQLP